SSYESLCLSLVIFSLPFSISLFLSHGNAIVLLFLWMIFFEITSYVMAGPDRRVRRLLYPLRMISAAALVLAPFTLVLFAPYIIESRWFISIASRVSNSHASLHPNTAGFYTWVFGLAMVDP